MRDDFVQHNAIIDGLSEENKFYDMPDADIRGRAEEFRLSLIAFFYTKY